MASTNLIGDIKTVITNGPNAATLTKSNAPGGPIMDYPGNCNLVKLKFQEAAALIKIVIQDTASGDATNLGLLNGVQALLNGTGSPSTQAWTDLKTVYTNGPNAATLVLCNAPGGPIMDYPGNVKLLVRKIEEAKIAVGGYSGALSSIITDTDATDSANLTLLQGLATSLA